MADATTKPAPSNEPPAEPPKQAAVQPAWLASLVRYRQHLLFGAGVLMLAAFIALLLGLRTQSWRPVYAGLSEKDAARVVEALQKAHVPYKLENGAVLVPADRVYAVRIQLAGQGVAPKGGVGFELFDRNNELGLSEFTRRVNLQRALQGELARTIEVIPQVAAARVHIVLPEDSPFAGRERKASASVMLRLTGELPKRAVVAIQNLVAAAVPDLEPERVVVVDADGRQLSANENEQGGPQSQTLEEYQAALERRLEEKLTTMLERIVGPGQAVARVHVELDRAYLEEHATQYNPDEQVARSEHTLDESRTSTESAPVGVPGIASNTPGANPQTQASRPQSQASRRERTVQYAISSIERRRIVPAGAVRRITAAVVVGGKMDAQGHFTPLPAAERKRIEDLVKRVIGFDEERGDRVSVESLPLVDVRSAADAAALEAAEKRAFYLKLARYFTAALVALLIAWFGLRPLAARLERRPKTGAPEAPSQPLPGPEPVQALAPPASETMAQLELARRAVEMDPERARRVLAEWVSS